MASTAHALFFVGEAEEPVAVPVPELPEDPELVGDPELPDDPDAVEEPPEVVELPVDVEFPDDVEFTAAITAPPIIGPGLSVTMSPLALAMKDSMVSFAGLLIIESVLSLQSRKECRTG